MATSPTSYKSGLLKNAQRFSRNSPSYRSKIPNDSVVYYLPQEMDRGMKSPKSSCRMYKVLVLACIVSMCAVCVLVWLTTSIIEKRVMARLTSQLQHAHLESQKGESLELNRRSVSGRRRARRRRRGRRGSGSCCHHHHHQQNSMGHAVHLYIAPGPMFKSAEGHDFLWQEGDNLPSTGGIFSFSRSGHHNFIRGVKIDPGKPGLYEVYSQAAIKGRTSRHLPYNCAQQIVLKRNGEETVLVKSYITQHELGMPILGVFPSHGSFWALDTTFQYGVFMLHGNDEIRVSYPSECGHIRFSNHEPKAFYFGVAKK